MSRAVERLSRRQVLRGVLAGSAVTVGMPMLECFLNGNGTALASGAPLPTRFVHWFWGNGLTAGKTWWPEKAGSLAGQKLPLEIAALESLKDKINVFSHLDVFLDGRSLRPHFSGWQGLWTGTVPASTAVAAPSVDNYIADAIGTTTRFRSLGASCTGNPSSSMSYRSGGVQQPNEISPAQMYTRIFGPEFKDPNSTDFKPDPKVMARRSVLSAIKNQRESLARELGAADRARLDEFYTSVRQTELQVEMQLTKPAPMQACRMPKPLEEMEVGTEIETGFKVNKLMTELMAYALACDQTRVLRVMFTDSAPGLRVAGDATTYHTYSHQEPVSGPQTKCAYFSRRTMDALADHIRILDGFKEGDSTLLDRTLMIASSDSGNAFTHQVSNIPVITAGRGGGLWKTGMHFDMRGEPASRFALTAMQLFKVPISKFGTDSMETARGFSEVLA